MNFYREDAKNATLASALQVQMRKAIKTSPALNGVAIKF
jgi:hypothetical protein